MSRKRPIPEGQPLGRPAVRSIAEEWAIYQDEVLNIKVDGRVLRLAAPGPGGHERELTIAELAQLEEMRRCFFAGASALYAMTVFGLGDSTIGEAEAAELLANVGDEILAFAEDDRRRRRRPRT